jgi:hypothetical protein
MEAEDASAAEDVPGPQHGHAEVHHGRGQGEGESDAHQDHEIRRTSGSLASSHSSVLLIGGVDVMTTVLAVGEKLQIACLM